MTILNKALLAERARRVDRGQICSFLVVEQQVRGLLVLEDVPRPELAQLSTLLRAAGIKETILLTGGSEVVAQQIGTIAQVDRVIALPARKQSPDGEGTGGPGITLLT